MITHIVQRQLQRIAHKLYVVVGLTNVPARDRAESFVKVWNGAVKIALVQHYVRLLETPRLRAILRTAIHDDDLIRRVNVQIRPNAGHHALKTTQPIIGARHNRQVHRPLILAWMGER
jgi:hypothetical protein